MPSSADVPSPNLPIYMPGRRRICSRQSSDLILSSLYSLCIASTACFLPARKLGEDDLVRFCSPILTTAAAVFFAGLAVVRATLLATRDFVVCFIRYM